MSITSPNSSLVSNDRSPRSDSDSNQQQAETRAASESPAEEEEHEEGEEEAGGFESPSKLDITMADITMISDFAPSPKKSQQPYTFATTELSEAANEFS